MMMNNFKNNNYHLFMCVYVCVCVYLICVMFLSNSVWAKDTIISVNIIYKCDCYNHINFKAVQIT